MFSLTHLTTEENAFFYNILVSSANVSTAARFAIGEFNKANTEEHYAYKILNITSARMQIVAGINYILDAQLGRTVCKRKDTVDCQLCALRTDPKAGPKCSAADSLLCLTSRCVSWLL
uniref:Cystatin domain-containing protein n=1 Tax=Oryzias sinensis TaxID=183150 RepID=A0A8C8A017_9TELE